MCQYRTRKRHIQTNLKYRSPRSTPSKKVSRSGRGALLAYPSDDTPIKLASRAGRDSLLPYPSGDTPSSTVNEGVFLLSDKFLHDLIREFPLSGQLAGGELGELQRTADTFAQLQAERLKMDNAVDAAVEYTWRNRKQGVESIAAAMEENLLAIDLRNELAVIRKKELETIEENELDSNVGGEMDTKADTDLAILALYRILNTRLRRIHKLKKMPVKVWRYSARVKVNRRARMQQLARNLRLLMDKTVTPTKYHDILKLLMKKHRSRQKRLND